MFFASTGAVLDVLAPPSGQSWLDAWRTRVKRAASELGWSGLQLVTRAHEGGVQLAMSAPLDQLFLATEVNEWALCASLSDLDPTRGILFEQALRQAAPEADPAPVIDEAAAFSRFKQLQAAERKPQLLALLSAADAKSLPHSVDDTDLTLGSGIGAQSFPLAALPETDAVPWPMLSAVPTALVTGSNGKTTTVRLLAACARAHGWHTAYSCTDGVFIDDEALARGDYSGPVGARLVISASGMRAAIIETARGGILRRGLAVSHADAAVVTNISSDHFGEYGIDDLNGLADVKLSVAGVLGATGLLVLNADDEVLRRRVAMLAQRFGRVPRLGWFSLDDEAPLLRAHRSLGGWTCGVHADRLRLHAGGETNELGPTRAMPLTVDGLAHYNLANLAAAALAARALGIPAPTIAEVFARFGSHARDNAGRMMRFESGGVRILIDYAHNPDGLRALLSVAQGLRAGRGRLGVLLGHAGNRKNSDIEALADAAAESRPDLIVVKENEAQLRGRAPGEIPGIIRTKLVRLGFPENALSMAANEYDAARCALDWARPDDVLVLPLHGMAAREAVIALLESRQGNRP